MYSIYWIVAAALYYRVNPPPGANFMFVLHPRFWYEILAPKITKLCFGFEIFWHQNIGKKMFVKC